MIPLGWETIIQLAWETMIQLVKEKLKKERPGCSRDVPGDWSRESNRQASELVFRLPRSVVHSPRQAARWSRFSFPSQTA
jgi:hypothetical protein